VDNADVIEPRASQGGRIPLACAAVALLAALIPVLTHIDEAGGRASVLVHMAADEPLATVARAADPDFAFVNLEAHYDGVYFYAMAVDPWATGDAHQLIDNPAARYSHPMFGWLGGLLSLGSPSRVPAALLLLALLGAAASAWAGALLARTLGGSGWWGLAVAFNPGVIYSVTALTSEPLGTAVMLLTFYLWLNKRYTAGAACLAALVLIKDPFILVAAGLFLWEAWRYMTTKDEISKRNMVLLVPAFIVFGLWYVYVRSRFGLFPFEAGEGLLGFPLSGWLTTFKEASGAAVGPFYESQIGAPSGPLLIAFGGVMIASVFPSLRWRNALAPTFILLTLLTLCLGPAGVYFPKDLIRSFAFPLALAPFIWLSAATRDDA
jgi:hypothetical protein